MSNPYSPLALMEIRGLMLDPGSSGTPVVILKEVEADVFLPIWIGVFEANAIALSLRGIDPPRPLTHDLLASILQELGASVEKLVVSDLREHTFFAVLHLATATQTIEIDLRPSDGIALALRTGAPIFVDRGVLERAKAVDLAKEADDEKIKRWLEDVDSEDLGRYTM